MYISLRTIRGFDVTQNEICLKIVWNKSWSQWEFSAFAGKADGKRGRCSKKAEPNYPQSFRRKAFHFIGDISAKVNIQDKIE